MHSFFLAQFMGMFYNLTKWGIMQKEYNHIFILKIERKNYVKENKDYLYYGSCV